jgi:hypothetical protein
LASNNGYSHCVTACLHCIGRSHSTCRGLLSSMASSYSRMGLGHRWRAVCDRGSMLKHPASGYARRVDRLTTVPRQIPGRCLFPPCDQNRCQMVPRRVTGYEKSVESSPYPFFLLRLCLVPFFLSCRFFDPCLFGGPPFFVWQFSFSPGTCFLSCCQFFSCIIVSCLTPTPLFSIANCVSF